MGKLLGNIQKHPDLHDLLRRIYGKTIGFWWLKDLYVKNIGFYNGEKKIKLLGKADAEKMIAGKMRAGEPFMATRYGSVEFRNLFNEDMETLCNNAGFFPKDKKLISNFRKEYFESSKFIDILSIWNYQNSFFDKIRWLRNFPNIKYLIPLSAAGKESHSWMKSLEGKKVLVIHSFEATIKKQYGKRKLLGILPRLKSLQIIRAVQTIAGNKDERFETWFDALVHMKKEIDKKDFDIALIGCGAYGLPLAAHVKSIGKQAIHMGGGLQLLFGIKGRRWEKAGWKFNKYWIRPLEEDIPRDNKKVEGGCYW